MRINFKEYPSYRFDQLTDDQRARVEEITIMFRRGNLGLLDQRILEAELDTLFKMEPEVEKLTKAEKRKLRRKQKEEQQPEVESPLAQTFIASDKPGVPINLTDIISEKDTYKKVKEKRDGRRKITETKWLIKRDAVRKIAEAAGIIDTKKSIIIQPSVDNYQMIAFDVTVTDRSGRSTTMLGEASDVNTTGVAKMYKALTAERRGYVRAVFVHTGLKNLYGEDEFIEGGEGEDVEVEDEKAPTLEEFEPIAHIVNAITEAQSKEDLDLVGERIKTERETLSDKQVEYLRAFYIKKQATFTPAQW